VSSTVEVGRGGSAGSAVQESARRFRGTHGSRLLEAFAAVERFPALEHSRTRLLEALQNPEPDRGTVVAIVESDAALAIAVLRAAQEPGVSRGIDGVPDAVALIGTRHVARVVSKLPAFDFFDRSGAWGSAADRFRLHGLATQRAARRLIRDGLSQAPDRLRTAALLHDLGKLVLAYSYERTIPDSEAPPRARLEAERNGLGVDHASVGGVLARRLGLPDSIAHLIENHHVEEVSGDTAVLRLADLLAHYHSGDSVDPSEVSAVGARVGLSPTRLRDVLCELDGNEALPRYIAPSPFTSREHDVLLLLSEGLTYKQIAARLGNSPSTVRTHLNNVYQKLGVVDRAQAVLLAKERGWV
jgi:putative nucleotidyltransferase with HDIG domain